jgi:hypothetical protein
MRPTARLQSNSAGRQACGERNNAIARHAPAVDDGTGRIETGDTTAVLTKIDSKHGNRSLAHLSSPQSQAILALKLEGQAIP